MLPFAQQDKIVIPPSLRLGLPLLGSLLVHTVLVWIILLNVENTVINKKSQQLTIELEKKSLENNPSASHIKAKTIHPSTLKPVLAKPKTQAPPLSKPNERMATPATLNPVSIIENSQTNTIENSTSPQQTSALSASELAQPQDKSDESHEQAPLFDVLSLHNPKPIYPLFARKRQQEGTVMLKVKVSREGVAETVELTQSSGFRLLDESAQQTVKAWRFIPARRNNIAVSAWVTIPILFKQT